MEINNPAMYRELSRPFETIEDANEALTAFEKDLYELRVKHRIPDLLFVMRVSVLYEDGEEGAPVAVGMFGDENQMESLAGVAYGRANAERQERIAKVVKQAMRAIEQPKTRR